MSRVLRAAAVVVAGLAVAGCGSDARVAEGDGNQSEGKEHFIARCGQCHVLADAGTKGTIGPNLDEAFRYVRDEKVDHQGFDESTLRDVVRAQIAYPVENPVTGDPGMPGINETLPKCKGENEPQGCVEDQDEAADSIAIYVAAVAGLPVREQPGGGDGGGGGTDGESIFTAEGCGGCHTLAAAGSTGEIGPNLDETRPSVALAVDRVTNGKGGMPAFKDELSEAQIRAVAEFVAESAGQR